MFLIFSVQSVEKFHHSNLFNIFNVNVKFTGSRLGRIIAQKVFFFFLFFQKKRKPRWPGDETDSYFVTILINTKYQQDLTKVGNLLPCIGQHLLPNSKNVA